VLHALFVVGSLVPLAAMLLSLFAAAWIRAGSVSDTAGAVSDTKPRL
jgi:hypothetical protein